MNLAAADNWHPPSNMYTGRGVNVNNCEKCKFRKKYDHNPRSMLGRIWKWHIGWGPGWKSYLNVLPDEKRAAVIEKYR